MTQFQCDIGAQKHGMTDVNSHTLYPRMPAPGLLSEADSLARAGEGLMVKAALSVRKAARIWPTAN